MNDINNKLTEKGYGLIHLPQITDERGSLTFAEWKHLPFEPKRLFWIYAINDGKTRGKHAHRTCAEVVFAISGSFEMFINNGKEETTIRLSSPNVGIYIGPDVWCELRNFAPGTVCISVASQDYDANGYINSYDDFIKIHK